MTLWWPLVFLLAAVVEFAAVLGLLAFRKVRRDSADAATAARMAATASLVDSGRATATLLQEPHLLADVHQLLANDKAGRAARLERLLGEPDFADAVAVASAEASVDDDDRLAHAAGELRSLLLNKVAV